MRALAIWGILCAYDSINFSVIHMLSYPDYVLKQKMLRVVLIASGIYFGVARFGLIGVTAVFIVAVLIVAPVGIYLTLRLIDGSVRRCARNLAYPFLQSGIIVGVLFVFRERLVFRTPLAELAVLIVLWVLTYLTYVLIAIRFFNYDVGDDIRAVADPLS